MARNIFREGPDRYRVEVRVRGRRYRRWVRSEAEAGEKLAELRAEGAPPAAGTAPQAGAPGQEATPAATLGQVLDAWLRDAEVTKTGTSLELVRDATAMLGRVLDRRTPAAEVRTAHYFHRRVRMTYTDRGGNEKPVSEMTAAKECRVLRAAFGHAEELGLIPEVPRAVRKIPKAEPLPYRPLTDADLEALLEATPKRLKAFVGLCAFGGLRAGEALSRDVRHVDLEEGTIRICPTPGWKPKTRGSTRTVYLPKRALELLEEHLRADSKCMARRSPDAPLFQSRRRIGRRLRHVGKTLDEAFRRAGLTDPDLRTGTHVLRHWWATAMHARKVDLKTVQTMGGWASPRMLVDHYLHTSEEAKRSAAASLDE